MLMSEHDAKLQVDHEFGDGDIKWDANNTIRYPLVCTISGLLAGLFGVGGGIVKGPLMLEMGIIPSVALATAWCSSSWAWSALRLGSSVLTPSRKAESAE